MILQPDDGPMALRCIYEVLCKRGLHLMPSAGAISSLMSLFASLTAQAWIQSHFSIHGGFNNLQRAQVSCTLSNRPADEVAVPPAATTLCILRDIAVGAGHVASYTA